MAHLPKSWCWTSLRSITDPKIVKAGPRNGAEFVYVDIGSVDKERKRIAQPKTLSVSEAPSRAKQRLRFGDTVVSMTRPNLNAVALVPPQLDGAIGSTGFYVLRPIIVEPRWLYYAVQAHDFIDAMCRRVQGALYPAVRPRDIQSYEIPLAPLKEQRRICDEIDRQITRLDAGVAALRRVQAALPTN